MRVVLASNNAKKLAELRALFAPLPIELVAQSALGVDEAEEPHHSFLENALAKARHAARATGGAALADDSGLCVDALGGAPGVISSQYAGELPPAGAAGLDREARRRLQDAANNACLLEALSGRGPGERVARFVSVLVAIRHADDPEPLVATGRWEGEVLSQPQGDAGFGYDPLLFVPGLGRCVAELDAATKNRHSHRALAAAQMLRLMHEAWRLGPGPSR